jgi:hypothetical protein
LGLLATESSNKTLFNNEIQAKFNGGPAAPESINPVASYPIEIIQGMSFLQALSAARLS